MCLSNVDKKLD